ncbi:MAG: hypothetical protein N4A31_00125 [Rickettsiales bacterium]|jgi:hypothetical protein|nr:hypothetical protein [Rickettsiales bacterium]
MKEQIDNHIKTIYTAYQNSPELSDKMLLSTIPEHVSTKDFNTAKGIVEKAATKPQYANLANSVASAMEGLRSIHTQAPNTSTYTIMGLAAKTVSNSR